MPFIALNGSWSTFARGDSRLNDTCNVFYDNLDKCNKNIFGFFRIWHVTLHFSHLLDGRGFHNILSWTSVTNNNISSIVKRTKIVMIWTPNLLWPYCVQCSVFSVQYVFSRKYTKHIAHMVRTCRKCIKWFEIFLWDASPQVYKQNFLFSGTVLWILLQKQCGKEITQSHLALMVKICIWETFSILPKIPPHQHTLALSVTQFVLMLILLCQVSENLVESEKNCRFFFFAFCATCNIRIFFPWILHDQ